MKNIFVIASAFLAGCLSADPSDNGQGVVLKFNGDFQPAVFRLDEGRKYVYCVAHRFYYPGNDGIFREDIAMKGTLVVEVKKKRENGSYDVELTVKLDDYTDRNLGEFTDDIELRFAAVLGSRGGLIYSKEEAKRLFRSAKDPGVHGLIFRGAIVAFPVLPEKWKGNPLGGDTDSECYTYALPDPAVIVGKDNWSGQKEEWSYESVSKFEGGIVTEGTHEDKAIINGKVVRKSEMVVNLSPE